MTTKPSEIEAIYYAALEQATGRERAAYLDRTCGPDTTMRARVEALLRASEEAGDFLETSLIDPAVTLDNTTTVQGPGTIICHYKLLEKIGEGGMAVVYMAEQEQPIRRKVALKIIKLGMDTRQVIARFEAERQALAMMDHPNIARVLDAGATETGRPYFVMELVQGVSITEYCDKNKLSTARRLDLFVQVCSAVHHAHQKGIIHRDIKPTNVMVTLHDGKPVPKVIDFGIAKATTQKLTEKTLFTRYGHMVGTPAYMSPEQAEMSELDVDTRTDVYSLGVLLYELLTGTTPFDAERLREAGYVEMQRIIHEEEPTKPSTKLSTLGQLLVSIAESRNTKPDLLFRLMRDDLDWIVMKSLEKDRTRRYDSASALGADVQRHINNEPVHARAPKAMYRLRKLTLRHRSQITVALVIAALVSAVAVTFSMWYQNGVQHRKNEEFEHRGMLSEAQSLFSNGDERAALQRVEPILSSRYVGPDAKLLYARILVEGQQPAEAMGHLGGLLYESPEVADVAGTLLARILWEDDPDDGEESNRLHEYRQKAQEMLEGLLDEAPATAGTASLLLARMLSEGESLDDEKLRRIDLLQRRGGQLLPKTVGAYFFRATMALAIKDKLELLDEALGIDYGHYDSRRLRAFIHYASRRYSEMQLDVEAMLARRPQDPLGYSLRAIALQQIGDHEHAIKAYDRAIEHTPERDPRRAKLYDQRSQICLRMAMYDRAIADARECLKLSSDATLPNFRIFCALTATGDYEEARQLFSEVVGNDLGRKQRFRDWSIKHVFDSIEAGRSWHRSGSRPQGVAFLAMLEAEETYHELSAKAKRLITNGFSADWSPDGTELAFSLGVLGSSGVAIFDMGSQQTELLILPGKDPKWSPDGQHIAFVRDCQSLRLSELTDAERKSQDRRFLEEEVWIMNADGTRPRRLARGGWPSWSQDSRNVYYHSRSDRALYSISIQDREAMPRLILPCSSFFPSVSPDNTHVAYVEDQMLKIIDIASQSLVSDWAVPPRTLAGRWMPSGRRLNLRCYNDPEFKTGLWIYDLDSKRAVKVLAGQIDIASVDQNKIWLVFNLGRPLYEIWAAKLDTNVSIIDALSPERTLEEHYQEMVDHYTRTIEADPGSANGYLQRAMYYQSLNNKEKAHADMDNYRAILNPQKGSGGHRGRPEATGSQETHTRLVFGTPIPLGPTVNSKACDWGPSISTDDLELYFDSRRSGDWDIWVTTRKTTADAWGPPLNLGAPVNGPHWDQKPCISADGLTLFFSSLRSGGWDIWVTTREEVEETWGEPVNLGSPVSSSVLDIAPSISSDGLSLFFGSERPEGYGSADLWLTTRETIHSHWDTPMNLGPAINSAANEGVPSISADGLLLFFSGAAYGPFRADGCGKADLWVSTRATTSDHWGTRVNLGQPVNSADQDVAPNISADGSTLYFASKREGGVGHFDLWQVSITVVRQPAHENNDDSLQTTIQGNDGKKGRRSVTSEL